jgi:hypothetical protein
MSMASRSLKYGVSCIPESVFQMYTFCDKMEEF